MTLNVKVGDAVLFDHFGSTNRRGTVVKITKSKLHIEWMAPSSGVVRVVPISIAPRKVTWQSDPVQPEYGPGPGKKNVRVILNPDLGQPTVPLEVK